MAIKSNTNLMIVGRISVDATYIVQNDMDIAILPRTAPVILIAW